MKELIMSYYTNYQPSRQISNSAKPSHFEEFLNAVAVKTNSQPRLYGSGYKLICPAHDDKNPSLSISEAADGKILLYCFSGCTVEDICNAMERPMSALFPYNKQRSKYARRK